MRSPNRSKRPKQRANRINDEIKAKEVRLIGPNGEKVGIVPSSEALAEAEKQNLDLVEVASEADPPVCRIMDYSKLQYEKQRKQRESRKHQRHTETKEVKLRPNIDEHDFDTKLQQARKFLQKGSKVKLTLQFRPRELRRYEVGLEAVKKMIDSLSDIGNAERPSRSSARIVNAIVTPKKELLEELTRKQEEELQAEQDAKGS